MPTKKITFDTVRAIGATLPGVEESTVYGSPALKVGGRLLACVAINKSAEPNTLCVCVDFDQRGEFIETDPDVYYLTDHYRDYPAVLVRLSRIKPEALRDLLSTAWRFVSAKAARRKRAVRIWKAGR